MTTAPRSARRRTPALLAALASALVLSAALVLGPATGAASAAKPRAHASASYLTGLGDEHAAMFSDPLYKQLHTKIARLIVA